MAHVNYYEFKGCFTASLAGDENSAKQELGTILKSLSETEAGRTDILIKAVELTKISYDANSHSAQKNLSNGRGNAELAWAFYFWLHFNVPQNESLAEVDRILLDGKTFEEVAKRPVLDQSDADPDFQICADVIDGNQKAGETSEAIKPLRQVANTVQSKEEPWQPTLFLDQVEASDETWLSPLNPISIPFIGRVEEQSQLDQFVVCRDVFKMWAIVGPSGAGKTRLVSHWMSNSDALSGWQVGFLTSREVNLWDNWAPTRPTLIVIDYIHDFAEVIAKLVNLGNSWTKSGIHDHPVRLLIIDHVFPDDLGDLMRDNIWSLSFPSVADLDARRPLFFREKPLAFDQEVDQKYIIEQIILLTSGIPLKNDYRVVTAIEQLKSMNGAWHPLFAALVGNAIVGKQSTTNWSRRDLIKYYLGSSNRLPWIGDQAELGTWSSCFVAAATATRGSDLKQLSGLLPDSISTDSVAVTQIIDQSQRIVSARHSIRLAPFEPDILGETFFLLFIEKFAQNHAVQLTLVEMMAQESQSESDKEIGAEFIGFIERLFRNLSNDDQTESHIVSFWDVALAFITPAAFPQNTIARYAISVALLNTVNEILASNERDKVDRLGYQFGRMLEAVNTDDFAKPLPVSMVAPVAGSLMQFVANWDADTDIPERFLRTLPKVMGDLGAQLGDGATPLIIASNIGSKRVAKILFEEFGNIEKTTSADGFTALMVASLNGNSDVVELLLRAGASIDKQSKEPDYTALMLSAMEGHNKVVEHLLSSGAHSEFVTNDGFTALSLASGNGHAKVVQLLVESGANIEHRNHLDGGTPLIYASWRGQVEPARNLLEAGADPNLASLTEGSTPLMFASQEGHYDIAKLLIDHGCEVNKARTDGYGTALHFACRFGHVQITKMLISNSADSNNARVADGLTPLLVAIEYSQPAIIKLLLESGIDVDRPDIVDGYTALMAACIGGNVEFAAQLIDVGANVNTVNKETSMFPLIYAASNGHVAVINFLIDRGADVDAVSNAGVSALGLASFSGHADSVKLLIEAGADIERKTLDDKATPLIAACENDHAEVARVLISAGADVNSVRDSDGCSPLILACSFGDNSIVETLISNGADIEASDTEESGFTPLIAASQIGNMPAVDLLIEAGAEIDKGDRFQDSTALMWACQGDHNNVIDRLIEAGAKVNRTRMSDGGAPLLIASTGGYQTIVETLLKNSANPNHARTDNGATALMVAATGGHEPVVRILAQAGADLDARNYHGTTAIMSAASSGRDEVIQTLRTLGANINAKSKQGLTAWYFAAANGYSETGALLRKLGGHPSFQDRWHLFLIDAARTLKTLFGRSHLKKMMAEKLLESCFTADLETVNKYLQAGAPVDFQNEDGVTPLFAAVASGNPILINLLVEQGANVNFENSEGITALSIAEKDQRSDIFELLIKHGASVPTDNSSSN